jgi:DNA-binding SARP family transcriptional activator
VEVPPQTERLLRRLDGLETPVVQVWGWPGSGRAALLAALLAREDAAARALAPADVEPSSVRAAVAAGARWLVVPSLPGEADAAERLAAVAEVLPADRRLVFASRRRLALPDLLAGLITPWDLALEPAEVTALARQAGAPRLFARAAERVAAAADGWYRPLRLAAEAAGPEGGAERIPDQADDLAALPRVADFLRSAVLGDLTPAERAALARPEGAAPATVRRLREELGLLVASGNGLRPLHLLGAVAEPTARRPVRRHALEVEADPEPDLPVALPASVRLRLHLLGRPEIWRRLPGGEWHRLHWPLKRAFRALAYLASSPERKASREELIEALWPDAGPDVVDRNFHPTLSHLRRGLRDHAPEGEPQPLVLVDGVYGLAPELGWWTDAEGLEDLTERGNALAAEGRDEEAAAAWEAGWRLYRGDFLEGTYEPWAVERREEYRRRYLVLLQHLAAARERLGRLSGAVDAYRAVLVEDALQERVHLALMRLYARSGRRDLVRRQYQRLSGLLRDELSIEPLPDTTDVYHRLMTDTRRG